MSELTEGPYEYHPGGQMVMTGDGQMTVADLRGWGTLSTKHGEEKAADIMDANGRLLAASYELLEALRDCLPGIEISEQIHNRSSQVGNQARAAIEKATGVKQFDPWERIQ